MIPDELKPAVRDTLFRGGYNLLLGSGVSLDSANGFGELLRGSETLRQDICTLTGAPLTTSLTRACALLSSEQREKELTQRFRDCRPGRSVEHLPRYLWRRLFTFNIDDVIENLYEGTTEPKQVLIPLNFDAPFEPTPERNELHSVHLHGWVGQAGSGYVFSASEYVRVMSSLNPWMHLLSEILATESFVIAGTSLNEIDLEYYLNHRTPKTPRRGRGPSLLISPNPDVATRADCERYGLTLVSATFGEFMNWLRAEYPSPPSVADLVVPDVSSLFSTRPEPHKLLRFFSDFELVHAADLPLSPNPGPFLYGREPQWSDLHQHVDIERQDNGPLIELVSKSLTTRSTSTFVVLDEAGTGKTTTAYRVAHDMARSGAPVLRVHTTSRIDTRVAADCLSRIGSPFVLVVDGLADHAEQIVELLASLPVAARVLLATERSYRREYLDVVFGERGRTTLKLRPLGQTECEQLLERFRSYGLVGAPGALKKPREFAARLTGDPIAVAVCRILNDFRPLDSIVESLWSAATPADRVCYLAVSLAQYCYRVGVRYSLLQGIAGPGAPISRLLDTDVPLKLGLSSVDDEYVVALNAILADRILYRASRRDPGMLNSAFVQLASALAPHVNLKAIRRRSPEARLSGRLFDFDKVVYPLLDSAAEFFYVAVQAQWDWNSRYWEQRALLEAERDLEVALRYARHAVAIESTHPFPLTTLGKILIRQMEAVAGSAQAAYDEAFETLSQAIELAARRSRITVHPFALLLSGTARYCEGGGVLSASQRSRIHGYRTEAKSRFPNDSVLDEVLRRLEMTLGSVT